MTQPQSLAELQEFMHRSIGQKFRWLSVHMKQSSDERFAKLNPPRQEQLFHPVDT